MEIVLTTGDGDCETAARRAVEDGCTHLFIGGGDGTLNEALNGVAAIDGALATTTFGVIPLGTGNDFVRALGIPGDLDEALATLLEDKVVDVDLGVVNGRVFANVSGGGFIAEVSEAVTPQMKSIVGRLAYLLGGAQALLEFDPVPASVTTQEAGSGPVASSCGTEQIQSTLYAFAVCNSRLIGGGRLIAPHAVIDDGLLDICLIDAMSALDFVALLRQVSDGGHIDDPRVRYLRAASVQMEFARTIRINTDGEVLEASRCDYRILPRAAHFLGADAPFAAAESVG